MLDLYLRHQAVVSSASASVYCVLHGWRVAMHRLLLRIPTQRIRFGRRFVRLLRFVGVYLSASWPPPCFGPERSRRRRQTRQPPIACWPVELEESGDGCARAMSSGSKSSSAVAYFCHARDPGSARDRPRPDASEIRRRLAAFRGNPWRVRDRGLAITVGVSDLMPSAVARWRRVRSISPPRVPAGVIDDREFVALSLTYSELTRARATAHTSTRLTPPRAARPALPRACCPSSSRRRRARRVPRLTTLPAPSRPSRRMHLARCVPLGHAQRGLRRGIAHAPQSTTRKGISSMRPAYRASASA